MQAAIHGNETVFRILRSKGAAHCLKDHKSETALHFAALNGDYTILNRLRAASADINALNSCEIMPIQEAASTDKIYIE